MSRNTVMGDGLTRGSAEGVVATAQRRARAACFVGREAELRGFVEMLAAGTTPRIVIVHGDGGIGKSSLLDAFQGVAERHGNGFACLDARLLPPAPASVKKAVEDALARLDARSDRPRVLALDHVEQLAALDGWLRAELLPGLPANIVLVLAGRRPPDPEWRADPGIADLLIEYPLQPLDTVLAADYLQRRGVDPQQYDAIQRFAYGNPLALALAADQVLREPDRPFDATVLPDLIHMLVKWLLGDFETPNELQALRACATVRRLDQPLLAAMLRDREADRAFDWLTDQHFVERQTRGVVIHDLVREVVIQDLRSRDLEQHHNLIRRATAHGLAGINTLPPFAKYQVIRDGIYMLRHEPFIQSLLGFGGAECYPDAARDEEIPALADEVEQLEGAISRFWFEYWARGRAHERVVLRDRDRQPVALLLVLQFDAADMAAGHEDPSVNAFLQHLRDRAPLRGGEVGQLVRFMIAHGTHQAHSPIRAELSAQTNARNFTPGISLHAFVATLGYDWRGVEEIGGYQAGPDSHHCVDGQEYVIYAHDLRREPPFDWAHNIVERILRGCTTPELQPADVVLAEKPAFAAAVNHALNAFHDETALARNQLLWSPMLLRYGSLGDTNSLRRLIERTSAEELGGENGQGVPHEALVRTYFQTAPKQLVIAEEMHISERTLRRRLRKAESQLVAALWRLETGGW